LARLAKDWKVETQKDHFPHYFLLDGDISQTLAYVVLSLITSTLNLNEQAKRIMLRYKESSKIKLGLSLMSLKNTECLIARLYSKYWLNPLIL